MKTDSGLRVIITSLLIDLFAFTIILPLLPRLLSNYKSQNDSSFQYFDSFITYLRTLISSEERNDVILLGGFLGSLYSFLQFISAPVIGRLSDAYGRRPVILVSMIGNAASMLIWTFASSFDLFLLSRVIGGLTEGNVQMTVAMISDISTEANRSQALALVGICFAVGFTIGPPLGAFLTSIDLSTYFPSLPLNQYSTPAIFALVLIVIETTYMYYYLPETLTVRISKPVQKSTVTRLAVIHFLFLMVFSGMEFTLTFLTYDRFRFTNLDQGKLLGFMGILSATIQGGYVRRKKNSEKQLLIQGLVFCSLGLFFIGSATALKQLYLGVACLAFTSGTVVTSLTSLASFEGVEKGKTLGNFRSIGQLGRCLGPIIACGGYWVYGGERMYAFASIYMVLLGCLVFKTVSPRLKVIKKE